MPGSVVELTGISKRFPGVLALDGVSAKFEPGKCHALMGENGAGKSTMGKILAGLYEPDAGTITVDGQAKSFRGPHDAQAAGIGIVHQELLFCENMTVAENLSLGHMPSKCGLASFKQMEDRAREWLKLVNADIPPKRMLGALPIAQRQLIQIAGAVGAGARVLIFDEPTSSLGLEETKRLLELIGRLKADGVTCVYVSHRLEEVFEICEQATVLRDGRLVGTADLAETTKDQLVSMMIGRDVSFDLTGDYTRGEAAPMLSVRGLSSVGKFTNISFDVRPGEIVGLGGLIGAGRTEILEALFGLDPNVQGEAALHGKRLSLKSPAEALANKLALASEDRKRSGLVLFMNCMENISMPILNRLTKYGLINRNAERQVSQKFFDRMRVKAPKLTTPSAALSGGNQQKLVLAKWLGTQPEVFLIDEPTRGVDVGAKAEIHNLIRELAAEGKAVIVVSSEMPELIAVSHRILILRLGRIVGQVKASEATEEILMRLMAGLAA